MIRTLAMLIISLVFFTLPSQAFAQATPQTAPESTPDALVTIEARAKKVGQSLRCVVCQNQSIEESDASLAEDMRRLVRSRMRAGDSDADVIAFMRERYGDYVLLKPPLQTSTYILWFAPFALVGLGGLWFVLSARKRRPEDALAPLSDADRAVLDRILSGSD